LAALRK